MRVNYQNQEVLLPDFLLVGAAKAGTTSIHHFLKQHNDIFMPIGRKESFFFTYAIRQQSTMENVRIISYLILLSTFPGLVRFKMKSILENAPIFIYIVMMRRLRILNRCMES